VDLRGRDKMGKVAIKIRVMPNEAGINMEEFKNNVTKVLPEYAQLVNAEIKPIAFGLKALLLQIIMPDQSPDELIEKLRGVEKVENVEVEDLSLI
jgi:elongation factor 1-beta